MTEENNGLTVQLKLYPAQAKILKKSFNVLRRREKTKLKRVVKFILKKYGKISTQKEII